MVKEGREEKQNHKKKELLFFSLLGVLALLLFTFLGERGYVLFDDSPSYMNLYIRMEGVMPGYPLFLHANKLLFGGQNYLYAVVAQQIVLAAVCVSVFTALIKKKFRLGYWETAVCFAFALMPFTTNMPESMTPHEILTEGIAYSLYYLFAAALLQTVWCKSFRWFGALCAMTLILALIRSQLQILFAVCGVVCIYIIVLRPVTAKGRRKHRLLSLFLGLLCCMAVCLAGVGITWKASVVFQEKKIQVLRAQQEKEEAVDTDEKQNTPSNSAYTTSQYVTLLFSRGFYEADQEDDRLFEDEQVRELFLFLYPLVDQQQLRYEYARPGLWMWKDIVGGIGKIGPTTYHEQYRFYQENDPGLLYEERYGSVRDGNQIKIGLTLLKAHFGRFLYHTLMLLPQGFICTVFFQIESIYLLCHLVTLFVYLSAAILAIWAYWDKKASNVYGEFMGAVLGTNLILVLAISLVFFGQQRYLVYNFGIFYMAYFLLLVQLWKCYLRELAAKIGRHLRKRRGL